MTASGITAPTRSTRRGREEARRDPSVLVALTLGLLTFASVGISLGLAFVMILMFPLLTGLVLSNRSRLEPVRDGRVLLGLALAFSGTWVGIAWNTEAFTGSLHDERGYASYQLWLEENGAGREHYGTDVVTGFPLRAIEGSSSGWAPEHLLPGKGLGALSANFLLLTAAFAVLAFVVPRRLVWRLAWLAIGFAPLAGLLGLGQLWWLLD